VARVRDEEESTTSLLRPLTGTAPYRPVILGGRPTGVRIACNNGCDVPAVSPHCAEHEMAKVQLRKRGSAHVTRNAQRAACPLLEGHSPRPA
jgi:hypothetical protein